AEEHQKLHDAAAQQRDSATSERDQIAERFASLDASFNQRVNMLNSEHKKQLDTVGTAQKSQIEALNRQRENLERERNALAPRLDAADTPRYQELAAWKQQGDELSARLAQAEHAGSTELAAVRGQLDTL